MINPHSHTKTLATEMQHFVDDQTISGAVLLMGNSAGITHVESIGFADIENQRPMQPDTMFWIASNSKQITAAAVMLLVDSGDLRLEDSISNFLPEFAGQMYTAESDEDHKLLRKLSRPITIRDLLAHTSGILPWHPGDLNDGRLSDRVRYAAAHPLNFDPGTKWEYGNGGFEAAGRIVEVVSGMAFDRFMVERLFKPLGMHDTTFWPSDEQLTRLAVPYAPSETTVGLVPDTLPFSYPLAGLSGSPSPGGGLFSTAGDCCQFCRMIVSGGLFDGQRILSAGAVAEMLTTQTGTLLSPDGVSGYGLGWNATCKGLSGPWPAGLGFAHHGGAHGTNMWVNPETNRIKILMIAQTRWRPEPSGGGVVEEFWRIADTMTEVPTT